MAVKPLCFMPADITCSWWISLSVMSISCCVWNFLKTSVLVPSLWVAVIPYFISIFLTMPILLLQLVNGCNPLLKCKLADNTCSCFFSLWVTIIPQYASSMLMTPVFDSPVGEWLPYCISLCFKPINDTCSWLSSKWVASMHLHFVPANDVCSWPLLTSL